MDHFDQNKPARPRGGRRQTLKIVFGMLLYMIPLFWMWDGDGYPDSLGIHIAAHGRAGLIEHWWYSYLLVERHHVLDLALFLYMWLPLAGLIGYFAWSWLRKLGPGALSIHAGPPREGPWS